MLPKEDSFRDYFASTLTLAGYDDASNCPYALRVMKKNFCIYEVDRSFPSLRRDNVPSSIANAEYQLDLDKLRIQPLNLTDVLQANGLIHGA